ncbi:MAG: secretion system protein, partial [Nitrosopumilaceae archaeon]|nr:secretion system protein [Nitrosopumilaceae archaeon]NIT99987.1 secretion system protein [Nitrosopumilaceae archaeon]NIU86363.1 secretion system protein [Nitrosopumilaceae archaeon]NIV65092.1 secretion system protein [Nitrosopumilaceae archaeon]NIX60590.1 secretion system protein [Nitrosopumilaceae archaeon]
TGVFEKYNTFIMMFSLVIAATIPATKFKITYKKSTDAEASTPRIMRDIAESRKAGTSPEKCVI